VSKISQNHIVDAQVAFDSALCYGYVAGVLDVIVIEDADFSSAGAARLCRPPDLNANTATEIVGKYLDGHPERRLASGYALVREALATAFPCR
jgi:hypothetical protein